MAKDQRLVCQIEGDELVIRIGIDTLAFSAEHCPLFYDDRDRCEAPYVKVADKEELARDVVRAINHEEDDGSTPLHHMLDEAIEYAHGDGSLGFADEESK